MNICNNEHEVICYECENCPLCAEIYQEGNVEVLYVDEVEKTITLKVSEMPSLSIGDEMVLLPVWDN